MYTLLQHGADANVVDYNFGRSPLHYAAAHGNISAIVDLLNHGANPNFRDWHARRTPLHYAIIFGHLEVAKVMINHGAKLHNIVSGKPEKNYFTVVNKVLIWLLRSQPSQQEISFIRSCTNSTTRRCGSGSYENSQQAAKGGKPMSAERRSGVKQPSKRERDDDPDGNPDKLPASNDDPSFISKGTRLHLACPYYKHCPEYYSEQRACRGPEGWPDVHRLK